MLLQQGDDLELVVSTLVAVLSSQRNLLEYLPSLGHLPRVVELLHKSQAVVRAAVLTIHQTTFSTVSTSTYLFYILHILYFNTLHILIFYIFYILHILYFNILHILYFTFYIF